MTAVILYLCSSCTINPVQWKLLYFICVAAVPSTLYNDSCYNVLMQQLYQKPCTMTAAILYLLHHQPCSMTTVKLYLYSRCTINPKQWQLLYCTCAVAVHQPFTMTAVITCAATAPSNCTMTAFILYLCCSCTIKPVQWQLLYCTCEAAVPSTLYNDSCFSILCVTLYYNI